MKKIFLFVCILGATLFINFDVQAQKFPKMDVSPMDAAAYPSNWRNADKMVKVIYSRPQLKGRSLDKLAPEGKVWRTGANEAPEITFYSDVTFGDEEVSAGTYSLFTIPNGENWTVILSNQKNIWGSYFYNQEEDMVRITANVSTSEEPIEAFSIMFDGEEEDNTTMLLGWGNTVISVPVSKK